MNDFNNMALCLFDGKSMGGLAFMTDFQKTRLSDCYRVMIGLQDLINVR